MARIEPGLVHTPVTPFTQDAKIDFDTYAKALEFHLRHGADSLCVPMHVGESISLTDEERQTILEFTLRQVHGRVPVIAHVSDAGTGLAADRARRAEAAGAAAILATTPYYWTPPAHMMLEHFVQIAAAVSIPMYVYNAPEENAGSKIGADTAIKLIHAAPNFAGLVDVTLDWQFMIELMDLARPIRADFQLIAGVEFMVSAMAIGASGAFAPLAGIAPALVRTLYDQCRQDKLFEARAAQEDVAALRQAALKGAAPAVKAAMRVLGRECGAPRPPLVPIGGAQFDRLATEIAAIRPLAGEPRGW